MNKIKNVLYGAMAIGVALAPAVASATPWDQGKANAVSSGIPTGSISGIIANTMDWLLGILGFLGIIGFVVSGILYLTSAGDDTRIEQAKEAMKYSILGVIVALVGFVVIQAVDSWLMGDNAFF